MSATPGQSRESIERQQSEWAQAHCEYHQMKVDVQATAKMCLAWKKPSGRPYVTHYRRNNSNLCPLKKIDVDPTLKSLHGALQDEQKSECRPGERNYFAYLARWESIKESCLTERQAWTTWKTDQKSKARQGGKDAPQFSDDVVA